MSTNFCIVIGSHRTESQSGKVARVVERMLKEKLAAKSVETISLADNPLPLWDEELWAEGETKWTKLWAPYSEKLKKADALIIVTPEWGGMVPPGLKNFFLLCAGGEVRHKPAYLIAVSAGMGGAYPIAELRASSYKNIQLTYLPEHMIIRSVGKYLNDVSKPAENDIEKGIRERLEYGLKLLDAYGEALKPVRASKLVTEIPYTNGL